jgi:hypothetical protein
MPVPYQRYMLLLHFTTVTTVNVPLGTTLLPLLLGQTYFICWFTDFFIENEGQAVEI